MIHCPEESRLQACAAVGMRCDQCVSHTAQRMAAVCDTLRGSALGQAFFRIYADPDCHRMQGVFEESYLSAVVSKPAEPVIVLHTAAAYAAA
jgi:hypothetical protein